MPPYIKIFIGLALIYLILLVVIQSTSRNQSPPGIVDGSLAPVTGKPNCISSCTGVKRHYVEPLPMKDDVESTQAALLIALEALGGRVQVSDAYLHATFTSRIFRFTDDLECLIVPAENRVHIRSASRLGYSDFNANRKRVAALRALYTK